MNVILFIINNFCLLFFAVVVTKTQSRKGASARILEVSTIYILEVLGLVLISGLLLERLNLAILTIFSFLIFVTSIVLFKHKKINILSYIKEFRIHIKDLKENRFINVMAVIVAFTLLFKLVTALLLIPYCYDSLAYHLPGLVDYIQNGKILVSDKLIWSNCYPRSIEMLDLWTLIYFRNGLFLNIVQFCVTLMGGVAVFGILSGEKIKKSYSVLGALLYLSTPIILAQISTTYTDTSLASIFICSIYFMTRYFKSKSRSDIVYMAILLGVLLGIKYSSIGYYVISVGVFTILQLVSKEKITTVVKSLIFIGVIGLLVGGVWYILNFINFNNPVYPFKISILGHTIFDGYDINGAIMDANTPSILRGKSKIIQVLISWVGISEIREGALTLYSKLGSALLTTYDEGVGGFGLHWLLIVVPSFIILLVRRIQTKAIFKTELLVFGVLIFSFMITPANWWSRYTCFIILAGIYSVIMLLKNMKKKEILLFVLMLFTVLNCLQGSMYDYYNVGGLCSTYNINSGHSIRDGFVQLNSQKMKRMSEKLNGKKTGYDVLCFDVGVYMYYYQGDYTQNRVKSFYLVEDKFLKNYNINTYEKYIKVIESNNADYIVVMPVFKNFMDRYVAEKSNYRLSMKVGSNILLYEKV
jgi:hypothetical protein